MRKPTAVSAFMNIEAWRRNENTGSFDILTKGTMLTVEGYFKPEEWNDNGTKRNRIVMVAVKFYPPVEKEEAPEKPAKSVKKARNNTCLITTKSGLRAAFVLLIVRLLCITLL